MSPIPEQLVGVWKLVSFERQLSDGTVEYPWGVHPVGLLVFTASGYMSGQFLHEDRANFPTEDMWEANADMFGKAFRSYGAYFGRYEVDAEQARLRYFVDGSWFPNWTGGVQERMYAFADDRLLISTPPMVIGHNEGSAVVTWQRVG